MFVTSNTKFLIPVDWLAEATKLTDELTTIELDVVDGKVITEVVGQLFTVAVADALPQLEAAAPVWIEMSHNGPYQLNVPPPPFTAGAALINPLAPLQIYFISDDELWDDKLKDLKKFIDNNKRLPSQSSKDKDENDHQE